MTEPGHLFIVESDLTKLHCDAILIPSDRRLRITPTWLPFLGTAVIDGVLTQDAPAGWVDEVRAFKLERPVSESPQVWIGAIGRTGFDPAWYAAGLGEFVERFASKSECRSSGDRIPRVAVPVVGTGAGGYGADKGAVFEPIVRRLAEAAALHRVDVVLVTWGPTAYAAAQRARQQVVSDCTAAGWELGTRTGQLRPVAEALAARARCGELVLFIGAGVSRGAGLPDWSALLQRLLDSAPDPRAASVERAKLSGLDVRDQALIIATYYDSEASFRQALKVQVGSERHALGHALLASLPVGEMVTTNYDRLLEQACVTDARPLAVLPYQPVTSEARWLLKLHGDVDGDDMVLTRSDYLGLPARSAALFGIVQAMLMTRHMLFLGYSLQDDSFHRVMHDVRAARSKTPGTFGTVLILKDDPLLRRLWGDDLDIVAVSEGDTASAARHLEIFLDLIGHLAADVSSFVLRADYSSLLTDEERQMASRLKEALALASSCGPLGEQVLESLRRYR